MASLIRSAALIGVLLPTGPALAAPPISVPASQSYGAAMLTPVQLGISRRPSDYSNGNGTNAANSYPVTPVTPYGGYVVNQYGYGNYVSGPLGYGGYPAGSAGAQIWRQREEWKCQNVPESC